MVIKAEDYRKSLNDGRVVYYRGKSVKNVAEHYALKVPVDHASSIYKLQADPEYGKLTCYSDARLGTLSSFYRPPENSEDLMQRHDLIYETTRLGRGQFNIVKAIGTDAIFALMYVTKRVDEKYHTNYYENVVKFYNFAAESDLSLALAQTDVKGNRSLKPSEQKDPDMYVHVVKRDENGIYVSGAKAHTTQSVAANEIIVIPTRNMGPEDKNYAVAFAIPASAKGITMFARPLKEVETVENDTLSIIGRKNVEVETVTVFDNVFIPNDRIFLNGEYDFAGFLAMMFPTFHRFTALSYRAAMADFLIGIGKLLAEYNGVADRSNIRRNLSVLVEYKETLRANAIAAAYRCSYDKSSKLAIPNIIFTNVGKLFANQNYTDVIKNIVDIAGGTVATLPSYEDFENLEEREILLKYLTGRDKEETLNRVRLFQTLREFISSFGALYLAGMIHAEGSIEASILELNRSYDYSGSIALGRYASGIDDHLKQ